MDRRDLRAFEVREGVACQFFPQPLLQFARRFLGEGDRDHLGQPRAGVDRVEDAADQQRGLAGAGRGFDEVRRPQIGGRQIACAVVLHSISFTRKNSCSRSSVRLRSASVSTALPQINR